VPRHCWTRCAQSCGGSNGCRLNRRSRSEQPHIQDAQTRSVSNDCGRNARNHALCRGCSHAEYDDGAFVRLVGNPADGTAKFQYGWAGSSPSSLAAGYWVGLYDVTNSHYVWVFDTGATDQPDRLLRNALPTADLANGEYKAVFFVRATYGPATNIAEIELPFVVSNSGM
jgi:hypothetical protein